MLLEASTTVTAPPSEVYHFFETMEEHYTQWHPDHVEFRWLDGGGLVQGDRAYFEERIGGKLQRKTVVFTEVEPDRYIEFKPTSRLVALLMPRISFTIDPTSTGCAVTQRITVRTGPVGARLNRREFDAVRQHMAEEGESLRRILEDDETIDVDA